MSIKSGNSRRIGPDQPDAHKLKHPKVHQPVQRLIVIVPRIGGSPDEKDRPDDHFGIKCPVNIDVMESACEYRVPLRYIGAIAIERIAGVDVDVADCEASCGLFRNAISQYQREVDFPFAEGGVRLEEDEVRCKEEHSFLFQCRINAHALLLKLAQIVRFSDPEDSLVHRRPDRTEDGGIVSRNGDTVDRIGRMDCNIVQDASRFFLFTHRVVHLPLEVSFVFQQRAHPCGNAIGPHALKQHRRLTHAFFENADVIEPQFCPEQTQDFSVGFGNDQFVQLTFEVAFTRYLPFLLDMEFGPGVEFFALSKIPGVGATGSNREDDHRQSGGEQALERQS